MSIDDSNGNNSELQYAFDFPNNAFGADFSLDTVQGQEVVVGGDTAASFGPLVDNTPVFFGVIDLATPFTTLTFNAGDAEFISTDLAVWATIPEPATLSLLAAGLGVLTWRRRAG